MLLLFDHLTAMFLRAFLHHPCQSVYQEGHDHFPTVGYDKP